MLLSNQHIPSRYPETRSPTSPTSMVCCYPFLDAELQEREYAHTRYGPLRGYVRKSDGCLGKIRRLSALRGTMERFDRHLHVLRFGQANVELT